MGRPLRTATFTEPRNVSDVVKMEHDSHFCREAVTLKSGFGVLDIGFVLGKQSIGAASSAAKSGGNTGDGTFVLDATTPILAGAASGRYTARFTTTTNIRIESVDGRVLGDVAIGGATGNTATLSEQFKAVVTQGATPFAAGDGFDVDIADGSGKFGPYDPTAVDGRATAAAVLLHKHDTTDADVLQAIILARGPAEVSIVELQWHANVTTQAHKDAAVAALKAVGIVPRMSA